MNSSNIQWLLTYGSAGLSLPQCAQTASSGPFLSSLGDSLYATNVCANVHPNSASGFYGYYTFNSTTQTVGWSNCGSDQTCAPSSCSPTPPDFPKNPALPRPCNGDVLAIYDSTETVGGFANAFGTSSFVYVTYSADQPCSAPYKSDRRPVFPACTKVNEGVYAITLRKPVDNQTTALSSYGCTDSACTQNCSPYGLSFFLSPTPLCSPSSTGSFRSDYRLISSTALSSFLTALPTGPSMNGASGSASTSPPVALSTSQPAISSTTDQKIPLLAGLGTAGIVLICAAVLLLIYHRRRKTQHQKDFDKLVQSYNPAPPTPPQLGPQIIRHASEIPMSDISQSASTLDVAIYRSVVCYEPLKGDTHEIDLRIGDIVGVIAILNDGWAQAHNHTTGRSGLVKLQNLRVLGDDLFSDSNLPRYDHLMEPSPALTSSSVSVVPSPRISTDGLWSARSFRSS
ncbi:uncharacterized protein BJ171DRAFT_495492 [Polychytrium aggregatum]|uniref:uncharacterized protein n=1 Tax=Polychytrium aggregatum TaxID=110093 RepID=UPI0022FE4119|nr:uncharacterized protein BJ171DRAFT_495492 [Polychytrium aggregatum]KAI9207042.1 hypothetical protein BJ171DRAFT_495492 [Polychytrium aggregatum]